MECVTVFSEKDGHTFRTVPGTESGYCDMVRHSENERDTRRHIRCPGKYQCKPDRDRQQEAGEKAETVSETDQNRT